MTESPDWSSAFLAVSFLLGEPNDASEAALGDEGSAQAVTLAKVLRSSSREARAQAVARVAAGLLVDIEKARLA
jgi:hypothetical protein